VAERPRRNEFERIADFFAPLAAGFPGALGLTDDAAVVAPQPGNELVVTTDTIVAGVHYMGDEPPDLVAAKLMRVNLSDLAAKGAVPLAYTLNIALPSDLDDSWLEAFTAGLAADQAEFGISLMGGDSVSTPGPVTLTLTAFGEVPAGAALLRSGARAGDSVYVTGWIGDGALGLLAARGKLDRLDTQDRDYLLDRYRRPGARVALGPGLRGLAHGAADVSDGLIADLAHITDTSGVAAHVEAAAVPLSGAARRALQSGAALLTQVLTGGDDYELIFTAPDSSARALDELGRKTGIPITRIGRIERGRGVTVTDASGQPISLSRQGYTHG
jgi:thiamine-monophosphate kinase